MGRLLKLVFFLIIFGIIGLAVFAYFGDLPSPNVEIIQPVTPNES